jgi:hypothetical protein
LSVKASLARPPKRRGLAQSRPLRRKIKQLFLECDPHLHRARSRGLARVEYRSERHHDQRIDAAPQQKSFEAEQRI